MCVEEQGFEPWAFRMQSGRSATELHPQICIGRGRGTVAAREVAALAHEVRDDAVEGGALEVERLARAARACVGTYRRHALYDRYAIRTRNLQDWNLTRCRCANRSKAIAHEDAAAVPRTSRSRRTGGTRPTLASFQRDFSWTGPRRLLFSSVAQVLARDYLNLA